MIVQKSGLQFSLTLPKAVIEGIGWDKGTKVQVKIAGKDRLELVRSVE